MIRSLLVLSMCAAVAVGVASWSVQFQPTVAFPVGDPYKKHPSAPRIEQVRALASLVTLDVPITDLHISALEGYTGAMRLVMNVRGDVQIMTDLEHAQFAEIDNERMEAVLVLPRPQAQRPRVDHEKTRVVEIQRTGMWRVAPGGGGEQARVLTNRAMSAAQRVLGEAAKDEKLIAQACAQTEHVMAEFFGALGWQVVIRWDDAPVHEGPTQGGPATAAVIR